MWEFDIHLNSFSDVREFVSVATVQPFPVSVGSGDRWVSAKSFIGLFSLNYHDALTVRFSGTEAEYQQFHTAVAKFLAA